MFRRTFRAEVSIEASAERVWETLVDLEAYPEWNPFTPEIHSSLEVGDPVDMKVHLRGGLRKQREFVRTHEPPSRLCWGMAVLGGALIRGERCQWLEQEDAHRVRYVSEDVLSGVLLPLVLMLYGRSLSAGFSAMASALKQRVEAAAAPR